MKKIEKRMTIGVHRNLRGNLSSISFSRKDMKAVSPTNNIAHDKEIDFFHHSVKYDWILTNPPFSKARCIFKRLKQTEKPFIILLPIPLASKYAVFY
jgi:hypothetical protein